MTRLALLAALCLALPVAAAAQFPAAVQPGVRVRLWLPEPVRQQDGPLGRQLVRGTVAEVAGDTLRLVVPGAASSLLVPRSAIRRLDVSRGRPSSIASGVERAVGGAIGGAVLFALLNDPRRSGGPHYRTDWRAAGVGATWGAGIGMVLGLVTPHEQWKRLRLSR